MQHADRHMKMWRFFMFKTNRTVGNNMPYGRTRTVREPLSADKVAEDLQKHVTLQETMKGVNDHWRKTGTCMGAPGITEIQAAKLDNKIATSKYSWERQQPFSTNV